ncbi:MAG: CsbD family protein [Limisphaerales bacterium]
MMKESTKDRAAGKAREVKGKAKREIGRALDRPDIAERGANEEAEGRFRRKVGEVEKVFGH